MAHPLLGQRFGHLVVLGETTVVKGLHKQLECACDCGRTALVSAAHLRAGHTTSCGCSRPMKRKHGASSVGATGHAEYLVWKGMKTRCLNQNHKAFPQYGGRGIRICDEWRENFEAFLAHVGPRPSQHHSIDRIDNDGHYEPGNVRWASRSQQNKNQRHAVGDRAPRSKLTSDNVLDIRRRFTGTMIDARRLAAEFHVTISAIYAIHYRTTWKHLTAPDSAGVSR